jgi:hypothetical protein
MSSSPSSTEQCPRNRSRDSNYRKYSSLRWSQQQEWSPDGAGANRNPSTVKKHSPDGRQPPVISLNYAGDEAVWKGSRNWSKGAADKCSSWRRPSTNTETGNEWGTHEQNYDEWGPPPPDQSNQVYPPPFSAPKNTSDKYKPQERAPPNLSPSLAWSQSSVPNTSASPHSQYQTQYQKTQYQHHPPTSTASLAHNTVQSLPTATAILSPPTDTAHGTSGSSSSSSFEFVCQGKWKVLSRIGGGAFGEVFGVLRLSDNLLGAVKRERIDIPTPLLEIEYKNYLDLGDIEGIPKIYYYGVEEDYRILIMQHLYDSKQLFF